jgi:hypothetical protein
VTDLFTQHIDLPIDLVDLRLLLQQFVFQFLHPIGPSDELHPIPLDLSFKFLDTLFLTLQCGQVTLKGVFQFGVPFLRIGVHGVQHLVHLRLEIVEGPLNTISLYKCQATPTKKE